MAEASTIGKSMQDFGFDMHKELVKLNPTGNIFYSPFSISVAMTMTHHGCRGDTQAQLAAALKIDQLKIEDVHAAYSKLLALLLDPAVNKCTLKSANRLYASSDRSFEPEFLKTNADVFKTDVVGANFKEQSEQVREEINAWVSSQTNDKIQDLIKPGILDSLTVAVLLNAVYFKGDWANKFDAANTSPQPFHCMDGAEISTPMMTQTGNFKLGFDRSLGVQVLRLPYVGEQLELVALLPQTAQDLPKLEQQLNSEVFNRLLDSSARSVNCRIGVPRFRLDFDCELNDVMCALGASDLYSMTKADLSGVDGTRELYLSKTIHKAYIEVNEEGSEAAAATANVMRNRCLPPSCFLDRPFIFVLLHAASGTPLFVGRMLAPPSA